MPLWTAVVYLAAILVATGIGMAVLTALRRRLGRTQAPPESGFTLASVRELRNQGMVTEQEYTQLRQAILGGSAQAAKETKKAAGG